MRIINLTGDSDAAVNHHIYSIMGERAHYKSSALAVLSEMPIGQQAENDQSSTCLVAHRAFLKSQSQMQGSSYVM